MCYMLTGWAPNKKSWHQDLGELPRVGNTLCVMPHMLLGKLVKHCPPDSTGRGWMEACLSFVSPGLCTFLCWLSAVSFHVRRYNHAYSSFTKSCAYLQWITESEGVAGTPDHTCQFQPASILSSTSRHQTLWMCSSPCILKVSKSLYVHLFIGCHICLFILLLCPSATFSNSI